MKLVGKDDVGRLYEEEDTQFLERKWFDIVDDSDEQIGVITGHVLRMNKINDDIKHYNSRNFFVEFDEISQLLCDVAEYIQLNKSLFVQADCVYFLNNLQLFESHISKDNYKTALGLLTDTYDAVIYSFGFTELDDPYVESSAYSDEDYEGHEEVLKEGGWIYSEDSPFFCYTSYPAKSVAKPVKNTNDDQDVLEIYKQMSDVQRTFLFIARHLRVKKLSSTRNYATAEQWRELKRGPVRLNQVQKVLDAFPSNSYLEQEYSKFAEATMGRISKLILDPK